MSDHNKGVWFRSAVSGLWYTNRHAAGSVSCVRVDGVNFPRGTATSHYSKILTSGQVAKIFGVSIKTVYKWFDRGKIKGYRIPGSLDRRYQLKHVIEFAQRYNLDLPQDLQKQCQDS